MIVSGIFCLKPGVFRACAFAKARTPAQIVATMNCCLTGLMTAACPGPMEMANRIAAMNELPNLPRVVQDHVDDVDAVAASALDWDPHYEQFGTGRFAGRSPQCRQPDLPHALHNPPRKV